MTTIDNCYSRSCTLSENASIMRKNAQFIQKEISVH